MTLNNNQKILDKLYDTHGKNVTESISEKIQKTQLTSLIRINELLGNYFISSCFHPNEFPIGAYRTTSLINLAELSNSLGISPVVEHLDTINSAGLKGFPNVPARKNQSIFSRYAENISSKNLDARELLREFYQAKSHLDGEYQKKDASAVAQKYINGLCDELFLNEPMENFAKKFGISPEDLQRLKNHIFKHHFDETFAILSKKLKKKIFAKHYKNGISETAFFAEFQNAILETILEKFFEEHHQILQNTGITNEKNEVNFRISHQSPENISQNHEVFASIIADKNLGEEFILHYLENILEVSHQNTREVLSFGKNGREQKIFATKNTQGGIEFFIKKGKEQTEISHEDFFHFLTKESYGYNISGMLSLLSLTLAGQFHIGSERGAREMVAKTLQDHLSAHKNLTPEREEYIEKVILGLGIFDTYDEKADNSNKNLAGSTGTFPNDMLKLLIIGGDFAKNQLQNAAKNNCVMPDFSQKDLLSSLEKNLKNTKIRIEKNPEIANNTGIKEFLRYYGEYQENPDINTFLQASYRSMELEKIL